MTPTSGRGWSVPADYSPGLLWTIDAFAHEAVDHRWVGQRRHITELIVLVGCDLAQDAPHDLSRARLGQCRCPLNEVWRCNGTDLRAHPIAQLAAQRLGRVLSSNERYIPADGLSLDVVRTANFRGFHHLGMGDQRAFD